MSEVRGVREATHEELKEFYRERVLENMELKERVKELEEENRRLNIEIGSYSGKIYEVTQGIVRDTVTLKILAQNMLKGKSE